jgi:hypothetical protein
MASERDAKFLKDFGPRVTELLDGLQKAAGVSERPMTLGDFPPRRFMGAANNHLSQYARVTAPQKG